MSKNSHAIQCRKSIQVISSCKDCPCHTFLWWGDPKKQFGCRHKTVSLIYKRIYEYYDKNKEEQYKVFNNDPSGPTAGIAFSDNDLKDIEQNGFPYWCPLDKTNIHFGTNKIGEKNEEIIDNNSVV